MKCVGIVGNSISFYMSSLKLVVSIRLSWNISLMCGYRYKSLDSLNSKSSRNRVRRYLEVFVAISWIKSHTCFSSALRDPLRVLLHQKNLINTCVHLSRIFLNINSINVFFGLNKYYRYLVERLLFGKNVENVRHLTVLLRNNSLKTITTINNVSDSIKNFTIYYLNNLFIKKDLKNLNN
uniref:NR LBD domain-containing protein n=1 Tax=Heterorhabditis bacteriophora TaxID=37862 RepID=A0A1I7WBR5_HETBA